MPHSHFLNKVIQSGKWESWPLSKICRCNKLVFGCKNADGSSPPEDILPLAMQYSGPDNSSPCITIYYQFIAGQVFAGNPICDASDNKQLTINLLLIINRSASFCDRRQHGQNYVWAIIHYFLDSPVGSFESTNMSTISSEQTLWVRQCFTEARKDLQSCWPTNQPAWVGAEYTFVSRTRCK